MDFWTEMAEAGPDAVTVNGVELRPGSRVRLCPLPGRDVLDLVLAGRQARVEALEHDQDGNVHLAVTLDDDPGRDLGQGRFPGHRFFFAPEEVEPVEADPAAERSRRILVAGIGNIFLGDDGFGVAVADALIRREWPVGVEVRDFGIRGLDLAYALQAGYDAVVLVDAVPRGESPGTLYVLEPELEPGTPAALETHGMDPLKVLYLARALGTTPAQTFVVGCEPEPLPVDLDPTVVVSGLSRPVRAAVDRAASLVESLVRDLAAGQRPTSSSIDSANERR